MYSLTCRVRVTTPPQYGRTAHAGGESMLLPAEGSLRVVCLCGMRAVGQADYRCALPRVSNPSTDCKSAQ